MVLRLRVPAPDDWRGAKCHIVEVAGEYDPFFDDDPSDAMEFCNGDVDDTVCPIRHECLIFALTNNEKHGVYGGTIPLTRRAIRRQWPLRRGKIPRPEWHWMTEEQALQLHSEEEQAVLVSGPDDDEGDEWVA